MPCACARWGRSRMRCSRSAGSTVAACELEPSKLEGKDTMSEYIAPLADMRFVLEELAPLSRIEALPGCEDFNLELASAIFEEAAKFASGVLSPLNASGDREGARWSEGNVLTAAGWRDAYRRFADGGWNALSCPPEH